MEYRCRQHSDESQNNADFCQEPEEKGRTGSHSLGVKFWKTPAKLHDRRQVSGRLGWRRWEEHEAGIKGVRGACGAMDLFTILIVAVVSRVEIQQSLSGCLL